MGNGTTEAAMRKEEESKGTKAAVGRAQRRRRKGAGRHGWDGEAWATYGWP